MTPPNFNEKEEFGDLNRVNLLKSKDLDNSIKNLMNPKFLGSFHLKREPNTNVVDNLLGGELAMNVNKSIRNSAFNPITKALIILMISFNLIWFLSIYLL